MNNERTMVAATNQNAVPVAFNFFDPAQFETMQRVSRMFASSDLVPDNYKPTGLKTIPNGATEAQVKDIQAANAAANNKAIANCMIALEVACRIGASPLMVMQNLTIIYGRPSWSAKFLISTVNTCGRFEPLQFRFTEKGMLGVVEYTNYVWNDAAHRKVAQTMKFDGKNVMDIECVAYTTKKGSKDVLESSPITIRMAIQEGWYTKSGSKWQTMAKQMLMYRAASWWTSVYAPELSMGMRTVEENQDIHNVEDAVYEEVTDQLKNEKEANANKTTIGFDQGSEEGSKTTKETVDKETGEILNHEDAAPESKNTPKGDEPDF